MMLKTLSRDMSTSFSATTTYSLSWWGLWVLNLISLTSHAPTTRYSNCCFSGRRFWFATHCILLADFQLPARKMYGINFFLLLLHTHNFLVCGSVEWLAASLCNHCMQNLDISLTISFWIKSLVFCHEIWVPSYTLTHPSFFSQDHEISWNRSNWRTENTFWKRFNSGN